MYNKHNFGYCWKVNYDFVIVVFTNHWFIWRRNVIDLRQQSTCIKEMVLRWNIGFMPRVVMFMVLVPVSVSSILTRFKKIKIKLYIFQCWLKPTDYQFNWVAKSMIYNYVYHFLDLIQTACILEFVFDKFEKLINLYTPAYEVWGDIVFWSVSLSVGACVLLGFTVLVKVVFLVVDVWS